MATRTKTTQPSNNFFDSVNLTTYEKPRWAYQNLDPMDKARDSIITGVEKQLDILSGKNDVKGRPWYSEQNGAIFVQWRLVNRVMKLKNDADSVRVNSPAEATRVYKASIEAVRSGQFDAIIRTHLASVPKRATRGKVL